MTPLQITAATSLIAIAIYLAGLWLRTPEISNTVEKAAANRSMGRGQSITSPEVPQPTHSRVEVSRSEEREGKLLDEIPRSSDQGDNMLEAWGDAPASLPYQPSYGVAPLADVAEYTPPPDTRAWELPADRLGRTRSSGAPLAGKKPHEPEGARRPPSYTPTLAEPDLQDILPPDPFAVRDAF